MRKIERLPRSQLNFSKKPIKPKPKIGRSPITARAAIGRKYFGGFCWSKNRLGSQEPAEVSYKLKFIPFFVFKLIFL